eukprot:GHVR01180738.1.p1 GENE.GHVR01180738.1~~GHVR01180738.1.p1  ORF type:complete len:105 (+),score=24.25 GHVR01180738.1:53-367(+)
MSAYPNTHTHTVSVPCVLQHNSIITPNKNFTSFVTKEGDEYVDTASVCGATLTPVVDNPVRRCVLCTSLCPTSSGNLSGCIGLPLMVANGVCPYCAHYTVPLSF